MIVFSRRFSRPGEGGKPRRAAILSPGFAVDIAAGDMAAGPGIASKPYCRPSPRATIDRVLRVRADRRETAIGGGDHNLEQEQ
jgi:hypothetical protein